MVNRKLGLRRTEVSKCSACEGKLVWEGGRAIVSTLDREKMRGFFFLFVMQFVLIS